MGEFFNLSSLQVHYFVDMLLWGCTIILPNPHWYGIVLYYSWIYLVYLSYFIEIEYDSTTESNFNIFIYLLMLYKHKIYIISFISHVWESEFSWSMSNYCFQSVNAELLLQGFLCST